MALSLSSRAGLSWKRMLVVLIAIPAVIVALLAMHLLLSGSPTPDAHAATESGSLFGSAAAESPLVAVFQGDATAQENCVDPCSPPHDERVMACFLSAEPDLFFFPCNPADSARGRVTPVYRRINSRASPMSSRSVKR